MNKLTKVSEQEKFDTKIISFFETCNEMKLTFATYFPNSKNCCKSKHQFFVLLNAEKTDFQQWVNLNFSTSKILREINSGELSS